MATFPSSGDPATHCINGHEYAVVGRYARSEGKGNGRCKQCAREQNKDRQEMRKKRNKWSVNGRLARYHRSEPKLDEASRAAMRTNRILALGKQLEQAMPWERESIRAAIEEAKKDISEVTA